jgi:SAM-dependent methyltransferase
MDGAELGRRLSISRYPRSACYDPAWIVENMMGPCSVWLTEALTDVMPLRQGDRVLDLGCGKAISSIFLAREFGVRVEAVDLWITADGNRERIDEAGVGDLVNAVHSDAASLPFDEDGFDAVVSIDAYHYFGTAPQVLGSILPLVRPGGHLGVVVPGLRIEIDAWPEHLASWWQDGFETFHSPEWWTRLWERDASVRIERADMVPYGPQDWLTWADALDDWARAHEQTPYELDAQMLRADREKLLGFARLVATRT